jgi:hypothetical protein
VQQVPLDLLETLVARHLTTLSRLLLQKQIQELVAFDLTMQTYKSQRLCLLTMRLMALLIFSSSSALLTIRQAQSRATCESATKRTLLILLSLLLLDLSQNRLDTSEFQFRTSAVLQLRSTTAKTSLLRLHGQAMLVHKVFKARLAPQVHKDRLVRLDHKDRQVP